MPEMPYCTIGKQWAYLNEGDFGGKGKISTLLSAYTAKKNVSLNVNPGQDGYCQIVEIMVKD